MAEQAESRRSSVAHGPAVTRRTVLRMGVGAAGMALLGTGMSEAAPAPMTPEEEKLYAEAKKEGRVVWWTAHYALSAAEAVRDAFVARYPGIEVQFIRQTAQVIYQRLTQDLRAGVREVDVFASTDESHYLTLKRQGVLASYRPLGVDALPKPFRNVDPDNTYHIGALGFVVINYNTKLSAPPQKWTDLLDGRWKGQITLGHPGFSGYVGNWVVAMWDKYGWQYFTRLAKNNPKIGWWARDPTTTPWRAGPRGTPSTSSSPPTTPSSSSPRWGSSRTPPTRTPPGSSRASTTRGSTRWRWPRPSTTPCALTFRRPAGFRWTGSSGTGTRRSGWRRASPRPSPSGGRPSGSSRWPQGRRPSPPRWLLPRDGGRTSAWERGSLWPRSSSSSWSSPCSGSSSRASTPTRTTG